MYNIKKILVALFILSISSFFSGADATPGDPTGLSFTVGNFWANYTWEKGADTDSSNISVNGNWHNGTLDTFINVTSSPHGWVNISVAGYNASSQSLSGFMYQNTQIPNNPIYITNVADSYALSEGQILHINAGYSDIDGDAATFTDNSSKWKVNSSTGEVSWTTGGGDKGTYNWYIEVSDGHGSAATKNFTVTVSDSKPGAPLNLVSSTGNFWVRYDWSTGANTDTFNVLYDGEWTNGSSATSINKTLNPHGWGNVTVYGYNTSSGQLSDGASQNTRVPNNPITITGIQDEYSLTEGQTLSIDAGYSDTDGDSGVFDRNFTQGAFNAATGVLTWHTAEGDQGTYHWRISVADGYGSISSKDFTAMVGDSTPAVPTNLSDTTGNFWVNHTWEKGANTDSFNISQNGVWYNGTTSSYFNTTDFNITVGAHGWSNISVAGYNSTLNALSSSVSLSTQVPNNPPTQPPIGDREVYKGQKLTFSINATDADSDTLLYGTNATRGDFNSSTGIYTWTPGDGDEGLHIWEFNSSDGYGGKASETVTITVKNPLEIDLKFVEPTIGDDNGTWVESWIDASIGHIGKLVGYSSSFKNTGEYSIILTITEIYNNKSNEPYTVTLGKNNSGNDSEKDKLEFEINSTGVNEETKLFNLTLQINAKGYNGTDFIFNYTNSTTISLPIIPIYKIKRANADIIVVSEGRTTTITYTLEANSTNNLTDVSIYDALYPEKQRYFGKLEANISKSIGYTYPVTAGSLSKFKCEGPYPCVINLASFSGYDQINKVYYNDTDYIEICVNKCYEGAVPGSGGSRRSSGGNSGGGGGGGGGGIPPVEDFKNIERREVREMDVYARSASAYVFKAADPVMVVSFESSVSENGVPVAVEVLKGRSKLAGADAPGKPYKYFNIFAGTGGFSKKISNGVVVFRVNNTWLEENGLSQKDISLYKWEGEWVEKSTEIAEKRQNYTYYASLTGNFSSFVISGARKQTVAPEQILSNVSLSSTALNPVNTPGAEPPHRKDLKLLPPVLVLTLGVVGMIVSLKRGRRVIKEDEK